jgi:hypothetical protein
MIRIGVVIVEPPNMSAIDTEKLHVCSLPAPRRVAMVGRAFVQ